MKQNQSLIAVLCVVLMIAPSTFAQQQSAPPPVSSQSDSGQPENRPDMTPRLEAESPHWYSRLTNRYQTHIVPPVNVSNSRRLESLMRGGNLYLSLQDAIALALENNVDIEVQRYVFPLAEMDVMRAKAGSSISGLNGGSGLPAGGAGGPGGGVGGTGGGGATGVGGTGGGGVTGLPAGGASGPGFSYDPTFTGNLNWGHFTQPSANTITSGVTSQITNQKLFNFGVTQGFSTGGTATLGFNNSINTLNSPVSLYNPSTASLLDLAITQPLLQGFGFAVNNRAIRVAKNNLQVADLIFKQQVITTVANIVQLYWNLVSLMTDVDVRRKSLALSQKLYADNQKQVEIGTLAPIAIVQAEAEVATRQQDLLTSETNVLQAETVIKNTLSRNGIASPTILEAHIVPTDPIRIPEVEAIQPIQDLMEKALDSRPELAQSRIAIDNSKINLVATKNQLLPSLNAVADLRNNALVGQPNALNPNLNNPLFGGLNPFFVGGYSNILQQLFSRNFPTYTVGLQLNIPLRNRSAQANMTTAQLLLRQNELTVQKLINQIRVDVQNALIAVRQARARHQAAVKSRVLQEQTVDAEQKKFALGTSTPYNVILTQRDLATAQLSEVQAQAAYIQARNQLDVALGAVLDAHNIEFAEAKRGQVSRLPSPLPVLEKNR